MLAVFVNTLSVECSKICLFSIIGIVEEESVYTRFIYDGEPCTKFIALVSPNSVDAAGILEAIKTALRSLKEPTNDCEEYLNSVYLKLINVNFDGASVMSGHVSGVQKCFKDLQPGLIYTHCVAHRLELAILDSVKSVDSYLELFDATINNIFKFYYISPVRRSELKKIADMLNDEFKHLGLLKNVRWLASRTRALNLLEVNYRALVYDLETKSYGDSETAKKALGYVQFIKTPKFLFYLHFFQDLVTQMKPLSLLFQSDMLLACEIPRCVNEKSVLLDSLLVTPSDSVQRLMQELKMENNEMIYKDSFIKKPDGRRDKSIDHNPVSYKDFYYDNAFENIVTSAQRYLEKRFEDFRLTTPLKQMVKLFDFKAWPKGFKADNRKWGVQDLMELTDYYVKYKFILPVEKSVACKQWPLFREKVSVFDKHEKIVSVYSDLLKGNDADIKEMLLLTSIMMTISTSTAACERGFSCMNREKTTLRTQLSHSSLDDIMRINIDGEDLESFNASAYFESWNRGSQGRHLDGHCSAPKKKKLDK